jgi:hypothetical protein
MSLFTTKFGLFLEISLGKLPNAIPFPASISGFFGLVESGK